MTKKQKQFLTGELSKFILREQGRGFGMSGWIYQTDIAREPVFRDSIERPAPTCGTVACIGGSAQLLLKCSSGEDEIASLLGLSHEQADGLFYNWSDRYDCDWTTGWPEKFATRYARAKTTLGKAKVAVALLKEVARTNGKCLGPHKVK